MMGNRTLLRAHTAQMLTDILGTLTFEARNIFSKHVVRAKYIPHHWKFYPLRELKIKDAIANSHIVFIQL